MKDGTKEEKLELANELYEKGDYYRALQVYDELIVLYRGNMKIHDIYYKYANAYYKQGDYHLASYHFKYFAKTFPKSEHAEDAYYMSAYCKYVSSSDHNLDQSSTKEAIQAMQLFINLYPDSDKVEKANELIDELRLKLIRKDFDKAALYFETEFYKSAVYALKQHVIDYPSSKYKDEAYLMAIESAYKFAENSIDAKKEERYKEALGVYDEYLEKMMPEGEEKEEADDLASDIKDKLNKLK